MYVTSFMQVIAVHDSQKTWVNRLTLYLSVIGCTRTTPHLVQTLPWWFRDLRPLWILSGSFLLPLLGLLLVHRECMWKVYLTYYRACSSGEIIVQCPEKEELIVLCQEICGQQ